MYFIFIFHTLPQKCGDKKKSKAKANIWQTKVALKFLENLSLGFIRLGTLKTVLMIQLLIRRIL